MSQHCSEPREIDAVFALLSNARRRSVLRYLTDTEETTARELARHLTSDAHDADGPDSLGEPGRDVIAALVHNHLPRLDEHDIVAYDGPPDEVTLGSNFETVEPFVEHLEEVDDDPGDQDP